MRAKPGIVAKVAGCLLLAVVLSAPRGAWALETDQFTPPPAPLVDLSEEFEGRVRRALEEVAARANREHSQHVEKASKTRLSFVRESSLRKARQWREGRQIAKAGYAATVYSGYPQCEMEMWARYGRFERQPAVFHHEPNASVFGKGTRPITIQVMSPTINLYGVYFGTDKLGHFFQQGYEYFEVYAEELARGQGESAATRKAILKGVGQENGLYGMLIDGVFSNADLAANYAGFKFYQNLTQDVVIDGRRCPTMLVFEGGAWRVNPELSKGFMRPFISEHFNEAMNPSKYSRPLRKAIVRNLRVRKDRWMAFYGSDGERERARLEMMRTWHGEEYGHSGVAELVTWGDVD